jgi:hypothetical protein
MSASADPLNLTGQWQGRYGYDGDAMAPVSFSASLIELGAWITGATEEQAPVTATVTATLPATIEGRRDGADVSLLKVYDGTLGWRHSVRYQGVINAEGTEIDGRWLITRQWTGWFLLIRSNPKGATVERKIAERV